MSPTDDEKNEVLSQQGETEKKADKVNPKDMMNHAGWSWTSIWAWYISEEDNSLLTGQRWSETYDQMRRRSWSVATLLKIIKLPLLSTRWYFEPASGEPEDVEIADFVEHAFFNDMEQSWRWFLEEALSMLEFGFSLFEQIYKMDSKWRITLRRFAFRKQSTIQSWETSTKQPGVTQQLAVPLVSWPNQWKTTIDIPAGKLLRFTYNQEWENYEWISLLRPIYINYFAIEKLYRYDLIRSERLAMPVPTIYMPKSPSPQDKEEAKVIVSEFKVWERSGIVMPGPESEWWKFLLTAVNGRDGADLAWSIKMHQDELFRAGLAQFILLWSWSTWSYALSEDQSDLFLVSLHSIANYICDTINRYIIPRLVDFNYDVERYPKLCFEKVGGIDYQKLSTSVSWLLGAWAITKDETLENFLRTQMWLPKKEEAAPWDELLEDDTTMDEDMEDEEDIPDEEIDEDGGLGDDSDLDDLDAQIAEMEKLDASEDHDAMLEMAENIEVTLEVLSFGKPLSEEHKKAISDALKNGASAEDADKVADDTTKKIDELNTWITAMKEKWDSNIWKMKAEISGAVNAFKSARDQAKAEKRKMTPEEKAAFSDQIKVLRWRAKILRSVKKEQVTKMRAMVAQLREVKKMAKAKSSEIKKAQREKAKQEREAEKATKARLKKEKKSDEYHEHDHDDLKDNIDDDYMEFSQQFNKDMMTRLFSEAKTKEDVEKIKKKGFQFNSIDGESRRTLTFAERKVNWKKLQSDVQKLEKEFENWMKEYSDKVRNDVLQKVKVAVERNDLDAVANIATKYNLVIKSLLKSIQKQSFDLGKQQATVELWPGNAVTPTTAEVKKNLQVQREAVVSKIASDIDAKTKTTISEMAQKNWWIKNVSAAVAVSTVSDMLKSIIDKATANIRTLAITGAINMWRWDVYERYPEKFESFQYSAILDDKTTKICMSLDGRVVKAWSPEYYKYAPPRHHNCRSIWVGIYKDEAFKPKITGIPSTIPADATIDLMTKLDAPVLLPNSPSIRIVKQEIDERQEKLDQLKKDWLYPNRQIQHQEEIDRLKKAISDKFYEITKTYLKKNWVKFQK